MEQYQKLVSSTFERTVIKLSTYEIDLNNLLLAASLKVFIGHKDKQMPKLAIMKKKAEQISERHVLAPFFLPRMVLWTCGSKILTNKKL